MRQSLILLLILALTLCFCPGLQAQGTPEPTGLDYLNAAREAEAGGHPMQALFLAGKAAGFSTFVDVTDEEYPPLLEAGTAEHEEALGIVERNAGYLEWVSPHYAAQDQWRDWFLGIPGHWKAVWSPDGRYIASINPSNELQLWDADAGTLLHTIHGSVCLLSDVAFSSDGEFIAAVVEEGFGDGEEDLGCHNQNDDSGIIEIFSTASGLLAQAIPIDNNYASHVSWSWEGRLLAVAVGHYCNNSVQVWDFETRTMIDLQQGVPNIVDISWNANSTLLVSGESTCSTWNIQGGIYRSQCQAESQYNMLWNPEGSLFCSWVYDSHTITIHSPQSCNELFTLTRSPWSAQVVWSPDGQMIAAGGWDDPLVVWDVGSGEAVTVLGPSMGLLHGLSWSPDGTRIVSATDCGYGSGGYLTIWDVGLGTPIPQLAGHWGMVTSVAWSPDGTRVVSGGSDGTVCIWDAGIGDLLTTLEGHGDEVKSVAYSPDGLFLASAEGPRFWDGVHGFDATFVNESVRIWDAASGELVRTLPVPTGEASFVAWSPDSTKLAVATGLAEIMIWDVVQGALLNTLHGHEGLIDGIAWSADGAQITSWEWRSDPWVWDVTTGEVITKRGSQPLETWSSQERQLASSIWGFDFYTAVSPDGEHVAMGGDCLGIIDLTGGAKGKYNREILDWVSFQGLDVSLRALGDIGEVHFIRRQ